MHRPLLVLLLASSPATAAPYDRLFEHEATFQLACSIQREAKLGRYDRACTPQSCTPNGELTCTARRIHPIEGVDMTELACARIDGNRKVVFARTSRYVRTSLGLWQVSGLDENAVRRVLRAPMIAAKPMAGVTKPKRDEEDARTTTVLLAGDRVCIDTEAGKSNPSWNRWCTSQARGLVGTWQTTAESIAGERCGDPL